MSSEGPNPSQSEIYLKWIAADMKIMRQQLTDVVMYMRDAEKEVREKMRRFTMYMHELHDIGYMYEERGLDIPKHILRELERCDDRLRQLLTEEHTDGGTFERVRREMAQDPENRWDHTRQIEKPQWMQERDNEARKSGQPGPNGPEDGAQTQSSESRGRR